MPSNEPIPPEDIEIPIFKRKNDDRFQQKLKKIRAKAMLEINDRYQHNLDALRQAASLTSRV